MKDALVFTTMYKNKQITYVTEGNYTKKVNYYTFVRLKILINFKQNIANNMCTNKIYKCTHLHRPATNSNIFMYIVNKIMFLKWKKKGGRVFFLLFAVVFFHGLNSTSR